MTEKSEISIQPQQKKLEPPGKRLYSKRKRMPGRGFLKNFFKVHGPIRTMKGTYFYYYSRLKQRRLALSKTANHVVKLPDYDMEIIPSDKGISAELAMFKVHEPLATSLLMSKIKEGMVCLDIGSNIGYYALIESRLVGNNGRVICIEPSPINYKFLGKNLEMASRSNVEKYNFAVGDYDGQVSFLVDSQSNLSRVVQYENDFSLLPSKEVSISHDTETSGIIGVPIKRVDSLMNDLSLGHLDFVRMDPEGYEAAIYSGMKNTIKKYRPSMLIEFHKNYLGADRTRKLLNDLASDNYESMHYIPRWMDNPIIAEKKYVENKTIETIIKMIDSDSLPATFTLFLKDIG